MGLSVKQLAKILMQEKFDTKGTDVMVRFNDRSAPVSGILLDEEKNQAFLTVDCDSEIPADTNYE